jgi:hypothetical protein
MFFFGAVASLPAVHHLMAVRHASTFGGEQWSEHFFTPT